MSRRKETSAKDRKQVGPVHEDFRIGQGYASGEKGSEARKHQSDKQYGDNPLPPSGGGYGQNGKAGPQGDSEIEPEVGARAGKRKA